MDKYKHYEFYLQCMETGWLPNKKTSDPTGLCGAALNFQIDYDLLKLFAPTFQDEQGLIEAGQSTGWWGFEDNIWGNYINQREYEFTTLRQTIVLFMACMAGEKF